MPLEMEDHLRTMYQLTMNSTSKLLNKDYVSSGTKLLENYRALKEVDEEAVTMKKDYKRKMSLLKLRKEEIFLKELHLMKTFSKFSHYIEENDQKTKRAMKKFASEKEIVFAKDVEISRMKYSLSSANHYRKRLVEMISKRRRFRDYLAKVKKMSGGEFTELRDIIARYDTLHVTKQELMKSTQEGIDNVETHKGMLKKSMQATTEKLIYLTMQIIDLKKKLVSMKSLLETIEDRVYHSVSKNTASDFNIILMSIESIRDIIYQQQGKKVQDENWQLESAVHVLPQIREYMVFLKEVIAMVNKQLQNYVQHSSGCN